SGSELCWGAHREQPCALPRGGRARVELAVQLERTIEGLPVDAWALAPETGALEPRAAVVEHGEARVGAAARIAMAGDREVAAEVQLLGERRARLPVERARAQPPQPLAADPVVAAAVDDDVSAAVLAAELRAEGAEAP